MTAIFKREFKAYFATPIGFVYLAISYLVLGWLFSSAYSAGVPELGPYYISFLRIVALLTVPVITMRLMSDDRRQKVDQVLLTSPVKTTDIILGKFLSALALYALTVVPTVIFELIISAYVSINWLSYFYAVLGILLLGAVFIAMGMFFSSVTESVVMAALITYGANIFTAFISFLPDFLSSLANNISTSSSAFGWLFKGVQGILSGLSVFFEKISVFSSVSNFGNSVFSIPDIVLFLSITAAFLFFSVRMLERRRWA